MLQNNRLLKLSMLISLLLSLNVYAQSSSWVIDGTQSNQSNKITSLQDPTRPASYATPRKHRQYSGGKLVLNSIVLTTQQSYAVINNRIYHKGEKVHGIRITHITKQQVFLANGRRLTLFKSVSQK